MKELLNATDTLENMEKNTLIKNLLSTSLFKNQAKGVLGAAHEELNAEIVLYYPCIYKYIVNSNTNVCKVCLFKILTGQIKLKCTVGIFSICLYKQSNISTSHILRDKFIAFNCFLCVYVHVQNVFEAKQTKLRIVMCMSPFASFVHRMVLYYVYVNGMLTNLRNGLCGTAIITVDWSANIFFNNPCVRVWTGCT